MGEFLKTSELTETRAFVHSFVKEVVVKPGRGRHRLHHPHFSINTQNSDTHGRSVWVHSSRGGFLDNSVRPQGLAERLGPLVRACRPTQAPNPARPSGTELDEPA